MRSKNRTKAEADACSTPNRRHAGIRWLIALGAAVPLALMAASPADVVVVCNRLDAGSLAVGEHYCLARGVPRQNIIALDLPTEETVTWDEFVPALWQPLQDALIRRGFIEAGPPQGRDDLGRTRYPISGHHIAALVTCRGVPLRIAEDDRRLSGPMSGPDAYELHTNAGAVDSELSLIARSDAYPINGCVPNPLFGNDHPTRSDERAVVKVTRLDGPTVAEAEALVDHALAAEHAGLIGRAYVDLGGPYPEGDEWLANAAQLLTALGFDTDIDRATGTFSPWVRFDAPAIYVGWYAENVNGPFTLPGFHFAPGAIAIHIHSLSATTVRSDSQGWVGPLVARGVTVTVGNVWEPYLHMTHRPDLLLLALARGEDLADAAYYALPALSWQEVTIGDPLYRPFAVPIDEQGRHLASLPPGLSDYVVLRMTSLLSREPGALRPLPFLEAAFALRPSLVLALALAGEMAADKPAAVKILEPYIAEPVTSSSQWGLLAAAANVLDTYRRPDLAEAVYRRLLSISGVPLTARAHWLVSARRAAAAAGDYRQSALWQRDLRATVTAMMR